MLYVFTKGRYERGRGMKIIVLHDRFDNEPIIIRVDAINSIKKCHDVIEGSRDEYTSVQSGNFLFDVKEHIDVVMTRINNAER